MIVLDVLIVGYEGMYTITTSLNVTHVPAMTDGGVGLNVPNVTNFPARPVAPPFSLGRPVLENRCRVSDPREPRGISDAGLGHHRAFAPGFS